MKYEERRRFERYLPPEGAIATSIPYAEFGLISNISQGGMAFEYPSFIMDEGSDTDKIGLKKTINIFIPGKNSLSVTIPCKIVRMQQKMCGSYSHRILPKKQCGVEFMEFGHETDIGLNTFLDRCRKDTF